jgi:hypothetical protein
MLNAPFAPAGTATITAVLRCYAAWLDKQDAATRTAHASEINVFLDQLLRDDAFGTEGQCDPRGDHRP